MRWLLGFLGLFLGASIAVVGFARLDHVQQIAPDVLPAWTSNITADSGVLTGRAMLQQDRIPPLSASWQFGGLLDNSPYWKLALTGDDVSLYGDLSIPSPFKTARLADGGGTIDLAILRDSFPVSAPQGVLRFEKLDAGWQRQKNRIENLQGHGQLLGLSYDGLVLGDGTFALTIDVAGGWRLAFEIPESDVAAITGRMSGRVDRAQAGIDVILEPGTDFPDRWKESLPGLADRTGDGNWRLGFDYP